MAGRERRLIGATCAVLAVVLTSAGCTAGGGGSGVEAEQATADQQRTLFVQADAPPPPAPATTAAPAPTTAAPTTTTSTTTTTTTTTPPPVPINPATTRYVSPPSMAATNGNGTQGQPWNDFCYALTHVTSNTLLVVAGTRSTPYDFDVAPTTSASKACNVAPSATDVVVWGATDALVKGELVLNGAMRWTFDNVDVTRSAGMGHGTMVKMIGGVGWRWTNCELWGSQSYADFAVGNWAGVVPPMNFRVDHCFIHDNPGWMAGGHDGNQDHNLYIFTANGIDAHGIIEDNVIVGAPAGVNVKVGGTGNVSDEGSDGITVRRNIMVNNRGNGLNMNICTNSDNVQVSNNVLMAQPTNAYGQNIQLGTFNGTGLELTDNIFWGHDPTQYPKPHPILWASGYGTYVLINLNEASPFVTQVRSVHSNPGYGVLGTSNLASSFPAVTLGGVRYGPAA